jgi:hypothetical protein
MACRNWATAASLLALLCASCAGRGDRYVIANGNQGSFNIKREENPMGSMPVNTAPAASTAPAGPTAREVELQKRIDELEAQQKATNAELERLKREKAGQ